MIFRMSSTEYIESELLRLASQLKFSSPSLVLEPNPSPERLSHRVESGRGWSLARAFPASGK